MPQQQIDLGSVAATGHGDFIFKTNQVLFARTTDATATQVEIFTTANTSVPNYLAGYVTLSTIVDAHLRNATAPTTSTTLTNDIGAFDTSLIYTGADPPFVGGDAIMLDSELMTVGTVDGATNTLSDLVRSVTPAAHTAGITIYRMAAAAVTPTIACWGKTITLDIDSTALLPTISTAVVRDLFAANKSNGALTWKADFYYNTANTAKSYVQIVGQAATTIDWTIRTEASIYYGLT